MIFSRFDFSSVFMWRPPWQWDFINRPKYRDYQWSPEQREAIALVKKGVSYEDENERLASNRWLFIQGPPGSGKSQVLLELAVWVVLVSTKGVLLLPWSRDATFCLLDITFWQVVACSLYNCKRKNPIWLFQKQTCVLFENHVFEVRVYFFYHLIRQTQTHVIHCQ